ncbi:UDP-N-acetylglucosamine 1-carboxyvinyltransferase [bacterium HR21]|jgi:UDP-N-acetylglucosamine 1-carboxyvinyltransferase|nr:UDP-N-acetylglucosamine 1-carboxyvinyltransferase [bacterium HR21]
MEKFLIAGGRRLQGQIRISGAKNAVLALAPATLLAPGIHRLGNVPRLRDVMTMIELLEALGCTCRLEGRELLIDTRSISSLRAPQEIVSRMRASFYVLGPLVARYGYAEVSLPGGCAWGPRPVDLHLTGLQQLGATIEVRDGYVIASATRLRGTRIELRVSSVGATGNILMAAALADGETILHNAAMEPEIVQLGEYLRSMGAHIEGLGTPTLRIVGVSELRPASVEVIPDRIEAATFLIAVAATEGEVTLTDACADHLTAVLEALEAAGCSITTTASSITLRMETLPRPHPISTAPYPGFPTDVQAQWTAFMLRAPGTCRITDTIYPDRFQHIPELQRLGARLERQGNSVLVHGGYPLVGTRVVSRDLRASAALIIAGLIAEGWTEVIDIHHIDRGYEAIETKLQALGAAIHRVVQGD